MRKLVLLSALGVMLALAVVLTGGTPAKAGPGGVQNFHLDAVDCLIASYPPAIPPSPDPGAGPPQVCAAGEDKAVGPAGAGYAMSTAIGLIGGNRTGLPYVYNGPGWGLEGDTPADYGNTVANLIASSDLFANGVPDITADPSSCPGPAYTICPLPLGFTTIPGVQNAAVPLPYTMEKINWDTTSGCIQNGVPQDETSLTLLMPGTSAMSKYVRWRACIGTLFLNGTIKFPLAAVAPLNLTFLHPNWSPAGTYVNLVTLATAIDAPTTTLTALDTPQASLTNVLYPYADNPHAAGLYVRWTTEISQPDAKNGDINFMYSTSCKVIGGVAIADADADCVPDAQEGAVCTDSGWPGTPAHTIAGNPDSDGDGLLDGVEIAWGSDPCKADTDNDGRTDLEEMIGPTQFLTDPTKVDTDGDTVPDGGLLLDKSPKNGVPDFPDVNGDGVIDVCGVNATCAVPGMTANQDISGDGSSHRVLGFKVLGSDIAADNFGKLSFTRTVAGVLADDVELTLSGAGITSVSAGNGTSSCPMTTGVLAAGTWTVTWPSKCVANGQSIDIEVQYTGAIPTLTGITWTDPGTPIGSETGPFPAVGAHPSKGDNCGSIANAGQVNTDLDTATTLGNGDLYGDACDTDIDNDSMTNAAEAHFGWDATAHQCTITGAGGLNPLDPDTDGDGILDGIECNMGSNPLNATDVPPSCAATSRADVDGDYLCGASTGSWFDEEVNWRTESFSIGTLPAPVGDTVADSDGDTLTDGCEVMLAGTQPLNPNTDGDNPAVNDGAEAVGPSALAPGLNACSAPTTEYLAMGNGASVAGNDTTLANSKGGRTADTDKDGLLNYQDPHNPSVPTVPADITYDTNNNGIPCFPPTIDAADHGPSWDYDCNGVLDGKQDPVTALCTFSAPADQDTDGDGLKDNWEVCKWGTNPNIVDSDSDGVGDCKEALDSNGDGTFDFGGDVLNMARAALLPAGITAGHFGRDGDFDLNGNGSIGFGDDVLSAARMAFNIASKPGYPGAPCK